MQTSKVFTSQANGTSGITVGLDAYTANDVVGGLLTFSVQPAVMNGGLINRVRLVDEDSQDEPYNLYLFNAEPSTIADDAAFAPTVADLQKLICVISISSATTVNSLDYWHSDTLNYVFTAPDGNIYGYLVANGGTPDYTNADTLTLYLDILSEG
jgi:hypothetical protein